MARDHFARQSLGGPLSSTVREARVLMVGAGGIGCELLKNLVLTGFGEVHIVDLDTIDLSNLNRQFLFRHEHIKKSKALVAKDAAHSFNPTVKLEAHHANIKDSHFNVDWFRTFTLVFNALDNLDARRHVNKMCLAADIPLIESGTTGFNGQVQVIKKGKTACYDCTVKEVPKSFPVCTIRSTPSQPIHCIVWGKSYLLSEVFGTSEDEAVEMDHSENSENAKEIEKLREESQALERIRDAIGTNSFEQVLFNKVFKEDIERLRSMEDMWKNRKPPQPLDYVSIMEKAADAMTVVDSILANSQKIWTLEENVAIFIDSVRRLSKRVTEAQSTTDEKHQAVLITFDKDDEDTLDFVAASANIRSYIFQIDLKSKFDIKQMAGNIIPAIATTNAIIAGLCVLQSLKVLRGDFSSAKEVFLSPFATERLLASDRPRAPNPDCPVCSPAQTQVLVDMTRATLKDLVDGLLRVKLGYGNEIVVNNEIGTLYDVEETDNLDKKFIDLGIQKDSFLTVIDEDDENPRVNLILNVQEADSVFEGHPLKLIGATEASDGEKLLLEIPRRSKSVSENVPNTNGHDVVCSSNGTGTNDQEQNALEATTRSPLSKKRVADEDGSEGIIAKRARLDGNSKKSNDDAILVEDATDGTIVIDD